MQEIYFISGLGADERAFQSLKCDGYNPRHIYWLKPLKDETISHYAKRLTEQIKSDRPILVALSFGGFIACEIAKWIAVEKIILISSAKNKFEIPPYVRLLKWLPLHRIIPLELSVQWGLWFAYWMFGIQAKPQKQLLKAILRDTDSDFFTWALDQTARWERTEVFEPVYHIHGAGDRILPIRYTHSVNFTIKGAGHFMIVDQAELISQIIQDVISNGSTTAIAQEPHA